MIRDYQADDAAVVLAINAACVPEVGEMDAEKLALFAEISDWFKVVEVDGAVVGMLVGLTENQDRYGSPNYAWFCDRNDSFAYVDRIALAAAARGQGWGPKLYESFAAWGRLTGRPIMAAEVNTIPDNPRSHHFHLRFGFAEVGRERPYGPDTEVAMYEFDLGATEPTS